MQFKLKIKIEREDCDSCRFRSETLGDMFKRMNVKEVLFFMKRELTEEGQTL